MKTQSKILQSPICDLYYQNKTLILVPWAAGQEADSVPLLLSGETHLVLCIQLWNHQHKHMDL